MIKATRRAALLMFAALFVAGVAWVSGQDRPLSPPPSSPPPQTNQRPQIVPPVVSVPAIDKNKQRDPARMALALSAQRGMDWLQRANKPNGRFVYGLLPSLRQTMDVDSYLAQVEAAGTLGRAARFFFPNGSPASRGPGRGFVDSAPGAIARQALLTLLEETTTDASPSPPAPLPGGEGVRVRWTIPPSNFLNRPAAAGMLVQAIHDLPEPGSDLLEKADQLSNFLRRQLRNDGSIALQSPDVADSLEDVESFSGLALLGIIRSQQLRPAQWKIDALRRARVYYQAWWQRHKSVPMVPHLTAAFSETFLLSGDQACADFVFEMNDWLCTLQYQNTDTQREYWKGGFMPWEGGKAVPILPDVRSAAAAQSLADACRAAQKASDPARYRRFKEALEECLRFLTTLQYTEANTQHFADWYRMFLVGGFHGSARDGNLRLDYTSQSVSALVQYLHHVQ